MERKFKSIGSQLRKDPSPKAWTALETKLDYKQVKTFPIQILYWAAAACFVGAIAFFGLLPDGQSSEAMDMTAYHPEFKISESVDLSISTDNDLVHELRAVYHKAGPL